MRPNLRRMKVLIVDDDRLCATLAEIMVQEVGGSVCGVAASAGAALDLAEAHGPDLLLMDMNLGRGPRDGLAVASAIRAQRDCRVVFVTGYRADVPMLDQVEAAVPGAQVLEKPVSLATLKAAIRP